MKKLISYSLLIVSALGALSACTSYAPAVDQNAVPTLADSYLYGRFTLGPEDSSTRSLYFGGSLKAGFVLHSLSAEDGKEYIIPFSTEWKPALVRVKPGVYVLNGYLVTDSLGHKMMKMPLMGRAALVQFVANPGKAYYLGDFKAQLFTRPSQMRQFPSLVWYLESVRNNFDGTTDQLKSNLPNFKSVDFSQALTDMDVILQGSQPATLDNISQPQTTLGTALFNHSSTSSPSLQLAPKPKALTLDDFKQQ